jgi:hypothetical protein
MATDSSVSYAVVDGIAEGNSLLALTADHKVVLSGLSPDTLYNYTVGTTGQVLAGGDLSSNGDGEYFFVTSPSVATDKDTRIWVIGDSGTANADAEAVREAYKSFTGARGTDVWLMLGDNAYNNGSDSNYQAAVFDFYPQLLRQVSLWSAFGNHDGIDVFFNPPGAYPQIFTFPTAGESGGVASNSELYYSFDYGNIHFISLDSTTNAARLPGSSMLTWLAADIAANNQDWTIAFWHHPEYSKGSHDSDAEVALQEMRQNVVPMLEAGGVDLILSGHSHSYERSFLVDGHHGSSATLTPAMILDNGDGKESGDGAYVKPGSPGTPNQGAIHAVIGSSGKTEAEGALNHPVMYTSMLTLGSMVLDVSGNKLDAAFIDSTGVVQDEFTIVKSLPQTVEIDVDPWDGGNEVSPSSNYPIPVAVLSLSVDAGDAVDFDPAQIDVSTLRFGIGGAANISYPWHLDTNADGDTDVVFAFKTEDSGIFCGDTEVSLVGETSTGISFKGTDTISTTDCTEQSCHP